MERRFYRIGQFARRACVSLRTLRYYDQVKLLSPSQHTLHGYRLYTDEDLLTLQNILALKFLGFSLEEIRRCLHREPGQIETVLVRQREMLLDQRRQLDTILRAIEHVQTLLRSGPPDWGAVARVIEAIQHEPKGEWLRKYFRDDQIQRLGELHHRSYTAEAQEKLDRRAPWTEEDQKRVNEEWAALAAAAERLAAVGADPAGEEGQALVRRKWELLFSFTQGDPDIEAGFRRFWESHSALPPQEQPLAAWIPTLSAAGERFLEEASAVYQERSR